MTSAPVPNRTPAAEIAERIAAHFGQKPQLITLKPDDWVGTREVQDFLRVSEEMRDSARNACWLIR
jgi:hypothetical protein